MSQGTVASDLLVTLTADVVAAHVSNNEVEVSEVPVLIEGIYAAFAGLGQPAQVAAVPLEPSVSIRSSVKPDTITCLECGEKLKMLKRHLSTYHDLSTEEYRARWSLASDYPMVAPNYAAKRRELAKTIGLGRKPGQKVTRRKGAVKPAAT